MKLTKKTFVSALLALAMVITCFLSFGGVTAAATDGENSARIVYVSDYYPTLSESELEQYFGTREVLYERLEMTDSALLYLANYINWGEYDFECFVLDLKLFQADADTLLALFSALEDYGLKTALVTSDLSDNFTNTNFMSYVDLYYYSDFSRLRTFIRETLCNFQSEIDSHTGQWQNINIIIDGYLIDADSEASVGELCQNSVFLRVLLDELEKKIWPNKTVSGFYQSIVDDLLEENNIRLIVHTGWQHLVDISQKKDYYTSNVAALDDSDMGPADYVFAIGFWGLSAEFYDFLKDEQDAGVDLPVYVLEAEPITYSEDGLVIVTDYDLRDETTPSDEVDDLLPGFLALMGHVEES